MLLDPDSLRDALTTLGAVLEDRELEYEIVVIGGGALLLAGLIRRPTKDLDMVARVQDGQWLRAEPVPAELIEAIQDVARALELSLDWLNPGPTDLLGFGLPAGFAERSMLERFSSLTVRYAARTDQIAFKVYAAADHWPDRGKHLQDLRALRPSAEELLAGARWSVTHDPSDGFREVQLKELLALFGLQVPRD